MVERPHEPEVGCEGAGVQGRGVDLQVRGWLPAGLELPLLALVGGDPDLCGREGFEGAQADDPVRLLRAG